MLSLKFTIYEILGYFLPGLVTFAALFIFAWTGFFPGAAIPVTGYSFTKEGIAAILLAAYASGHLTQGLCNPIASADRTAEQSGKHTALLKRAKEALAERKIISDPDLKFGQVLALAQTWMLNNCQTDDHDVFLYREGFYRGSSLGYILLGSSLVFRAWRGSTRVELSGTCYEIAWGVPVFLACIAFTTAVVYYFRFQRFGSYRIQNLLASVCLPENKVTRGEGEKSCGDASISAPGKWKEPDEGE